MMRKIVFLILLLLASSSPAFCTDWTADDSCEGAWLFEEASGDFQDASSNNRDGTAVNTPTYQVEGKIGYGVAFPDDDAINFGNNAAFRSSVFSVVIYVNDNATTDWERIIGKMQAGGSTGVDWGIYHYTSTEYAYISIKNTDDTAFSTWNSGINTKLTEGSWEHVAGTFNGSNALDFYIEGVKKNTVTSFSGTFSEHDENMYINTGYGSGNDWNGSVDEFGYFSSYLDHTDINEIMINGLEGTADKVNWCGDDNIVVCYNMETGSGTTVVDQGAGGVDATFGATTAAPTWVTGSSPSASDGFQGTSDWVLSSDGSDYAEASVPNIGTSFTEVLWVKSDSESAENKNMLSTYDGTRRTGIEGSSTANRFNAFYSNTEYEYRSSINWDDGNWNHMAYTVNSGTFVFYFEGVAYAPSATNQDPSNADQDEELNLFRSPRGVDRRLFQGDLDEVAIFNDVKDATDINAIMINGLYQASGTPSTYYGIMVM